MTGAERWRLRRLTAFMELYCPSNASLWFASFDSGTGWSRASAIWKRFGKLQLEYDLPQYSVLLREPSKSGEPGGHVIFIGNKKIAKRLKSSQPLAADKAVKPAYDWKGLVEYLSKKRVPSPNDGRGRVPGSHRVDGGGDRVRPSAALKADAIGAGFVDPWQRENARRNSRRKFYSPRPGQKLGVSAPRAAGQLPLLPELERPVTRLHQFGGGKIPAAVALELEHHRKRLGLCQHELARMVGRSQGQYANAIRGHDPISAQVVNRLREVLLAA